MSDGGDDVMPNEVEVGEVPGADDASSGRRLLQTAPTLARSCRELFNVSRSDDCSL